MEKIFTYGTLQDPQIQIQLTGHTLDGTPDTLQGYKMAKLKGIHATYNILQPQSRATVDGVVYDVTADELKKIDDYEGDAYMRVSATLVSDTRAWVYRDNPNSAYQSQIVTSND
jgi:gamma-glutamylcyclotransferase (GGCT)/AIG2-like uncharacterized protein YtfP